MTRMFASRALAFGIWMMFSLALLPATALAGDIALVIGNNTYRNAPEADSAAIDARAVARALERGGYDVSLGIDLTRAQMQRQLQRFDRKIARADRVVVFYSGHALRTGGDSYLAPVNQDAGSLVDVMLDGVPLDLVLRIAGRKPGRAVVFIDAAQLEGFPPRSYAEPGLAHIAPGDGVVVISAAAPGRAIRRRGRHESRFARQVIRNFLEPGARVANAVQDMRRPTWTAGTANPRLVLVPRGRPRPDKASPRGVEEALGLSFRQRRAIQENLSLLGYDPRGIDGRFGPGSRHAIMEWQETNDLARTGYLDAEQITKLERQARHAGRPQQPAPQPPAAQPPTQPPAPLSADDRYWNRTGAQGTGDGYRDYLNRYSAGAHAADARTALKRMAQAGTDAMAATERRDWRTARQADQAPDYHDYLNRYPTGIWQPEAEARLAVIATRPAPRDPAADEAALGLARTDRLSVEQRLNYLRFPPGNIDGFFDEQTRWAIEGYQRSRGFESTGYLDQPTIVRLLDETGGARPGIVIDGADILRNLLGGN